MTFGVMLPHFGDAAHPEAIVACARKAESLGFHSVWARDHLSFASDGAPAPFYEPLTTLTAVGSRTERIGLGTAALVPFRHPLLLARILSTMGAFLPGRLEIGLGAGSGAREFDAVGIDPSTRSPRMQETLRILRRFRSDARVSWQGETFEFEDVDIAPAVDARLWWCGPSPLAARLAGQLCNGWLPGRITLPTFETRAGVVRAEAERAQRPTPALGIIPFTSVGASREQALRRLDVGALLTAANGSRFAVRPPSGSFQTIDDLEGMVVYGGVDDIAAQCSRLRDGGAELIVFDLRSGFEDWEAQLEDLADVQLALDGSARPATDVLVTTEQRSTNR
jgi:alkanesulfonate monooxygenase SsuD/methylene tetrahydromethanopterin reductase-like flavin-dependent oxidoreductase (luciferase family)